MSDPKEDQESPELTQPIRFGEQEFAALEAEVISVIPGQKPVVPDKVRRGERSLPEALRKRVWPKLAAVRAKMFFGMDNESAVRENYLKGHPAPEGKWFFVSPPAAHN